MRLKEYPIGDYVGKCQTWNPKSSGVGSFDYIDLSSVDKDTKSIASIERYECSDAPSRARQLLETDDVLVATVRPNLNGVALVNGAHHGMTASTGYCVLRPDKDQLDPRFLFHWVKTGAFVQRMIDVATGASYPAVSDAKVKASKIPLPPLAKQKRIAGNLDAADALRAKRREALAQIDTLLESSFLDMFGDPVTNPMGWEKPRLEDVCKKVIDCPHSTPRWTGSGVVCLRTSNLGKGEWNWADTRFVTEEDYTERTRRSEVLPNDIILSREGTVGVLALVDEGMRLCMGQRLVQLRVNDSQLDPRFLLNLLQHNLAPERLSRLMAGSTSKHLNVKELRKLPVLLPRLDIQHRFSAIAESVEQQKTRQRAHLAELDTLFASLQSRAFRGDL